MNESSVLSKKRILFITGTRADFGKIKPLIKATSETGIYETRIFVTGMHMMEKYGSTWEEIAASNLAPIHPFVNQSPNETMDVVLAKTIIGLSDYIKEFTPDLLVVHGDRVEALGGAAVGALNNLRVAHIEGGEISGTVDESLRHAISKLAHLHFVSNDESHSRLKQLGEDPSRIFIIGSPEIDVMNSKNLPTLDEALNHYSLNSHKYAILLFHPVTTKIDELERETESVLNALLNANIETIIISPNNDLGSEIIREVYSRYVFSKNFHFFPSIRFEYFLVLLKYCDFIIGNSSAGVREAPHYGVPCINLGNRQNGRGRSKLVINSEIKESAIIKSIANIKKLSRSAESNFGHGNSAEQFLKILGTKEIWLQSVQKKFIDHISNSPTAKGNK